MMFLTRPVNNFTYFRDILVNKIDLNNILVLKLSLK